VLQRQSLIFLRVLPHVFHHNFSNIDLVDIPAMNRIQSMDHLDGQNEYTTSFLLI